MLLLISCVCCFTACSDDDDKGNNNGKNPITELYLSDEIETGASTTILGKGFAANAQIYVENTAGERTKIENIVVDSKGITFTLPSTLPSGVYALILKQDGGEWQLDLFTAVQMKVVTLLKKITGLTAEQGAEDEPFFDLPFDLAYDEYGQLKSLSSTYDTEEEGSTTSVTQAYEFTYTDNKIEVGGSYIDNENIFPITYVLENGKVVTSKTKNAEYDWGTQETVITDAEYSWNYNGDYLKSLTGTTTINYDFQNGNLMSMGDYMFEYGTEINKSNVDFVTWSLFFNGEITNDQFMAYLLGACGKMSANLPSFTNGVCGYTLDKDGLVSTLKVTMDFGGVFYVMTIQCEYETVKVKVL